MKIKVQSESVKRALAFIKPATQNKSFQMSQSIMLEVLPESQQLKLSAFDLDTYIQTKVPIESSDAGELTCMVSSSLISSLFSNLEGLATLTLQDLNLKVSQGKNKFNLRCVNPENWVEVPEDFFKHDASTPTLHVHNKNLLKSAASFTSDDISKGILQCIQVKNNYLAATDSFRLITIKTPDIVLEGCETFNLPAKLVTMLNLDAYEELQIKNQGNVVIAKDLEGVRYYATRTLVGNFPRVEQLIPANFKTTIDFIDTVEIKSCLASASLFSSTGLVLFNSQSEQLGIRALGDYGEASLIIEHEEQVSELDIAFNSQMIMRSLKTLDSECELNMNCALTPAVFKSQQPSLIDKDSYTEKLVLLMPVRVNK